MAANIKRNETGRKTHAGEVTSGKILTAHDLANGLAVYWCGSNVWSSAIDDAELAESAEKVAEFERLCGRENESNLVAGAYLVDVEESGGKISPVHIREQIRALGPTVRPDLGPQAWGGETAASMAIAAE